MISGLTIAENAYLPLRDVVFQTLRQAILKGELQPGERLMQIVSAVKTEERLQSDPLRLRAQSAEIRSRLRLLYG